ncbi:superoxide dismutase [Steroidobacter agaridevorans]|uniref:Superoxide dismutase n=1 Tax=Steroidobacter agaridevorans TaxID=2695856 RepID=A0A829YK55_9GAMM|nr:superoxide dismutase [Steroidobacter agaridevorans]GFE83569.1 superoxide dismutase [Steroidobacter agaridevorans]GFE86548.1 superoxide dismutase [Steroidobacter agaridevorans]
MNVIVPSLPYPMDGLEPHISRRTLAAHYGSHHVACVERTRALIDRTPLETASIETIVQASHEMAKPILFNAVSEAWNHSFYWSCMAAAGGGEATGPIAELIAASFGSQSAFREQFIGMAAAHVGSGWIWLVLEGEGLRIVATPNVNTWLVAASTPLLAVDVWEHAYYLDYRHRRADYVNAFITHLVNWTFANDNLAAARERRAGRRTRWNTAACAAASNIPIRAGGTR